MSSLKNKYPKAFFISSLKFFLIKDDEMLLFGDGKLRDFNMEWNHAESIDYAYNKGDHIYIYTGDLSEMAIWNTNVVTSKTNFYIRSVILPKGEFDGYDVCGNDKRMPTEFSDILSECISENSASKSNIHPESNNETNDEWDKAFTEAPVRIHPNTEEYFKQNFKLIKK